MNPLKIYIAVGENTSCSLLQ